MPLRLVAELLARRARHAGARWLLVALAVALAGMPLVLTPAVARTAAADALRRGVGELPAGWRSVIASWSGLPDPAEQARVDAAAHAALAALGDRPVRRQILFSTLADTAGRPYRLAATDDLAGVTRLVSGRRPSSCRPGHCEVVALDLATGTASPGGGATAAGPALTPDPALGLVVVGRVARTDPLLLSGTFDPGTTAPVLLADGAAGFAVPSTLADFGRAYGWVSAWDPDRVIALGVDGWTDRAARAGASLAAVAPGAVLTAPDQVLRDQDARARLSAGRLGLLGAGSCVVLLGAAVIGGTALRRDHEGFARALRLRGAGGGVIGTLLLGEAALAACLGALGALVVGGAAALVLAGRAGLPAAATATAALAEAAPAIAALAVAAVAVVVAAVGLPGPGPGGRGGLYRALEGGAVACLAAAGLLAARGGASSGADPLLTALPVLALTAAGLLAARFWPPVAGWAQRLPPRRALGARLGLATVAGRPARPAATAGVLTAAVATAVFAGAYAATLDRGAAEQAAHVVPLDARLTAGAGMPNPLDAAEPSRLSAALGGAGLHPVVRTAGSVRIGAQQADAVALVGVDPAVLPLIADWPAETGGGADAATTARRITADPAPAVRLPAGTVLRIGTAEPVTDVVTAFVRAPDGRERSVPLVVGAGGGVTGGLTGRLPALRDTHGTAVPLDLVAIGVRQPTDAADRRQHALGEGTTAQAAPTGRLVLGAVDVDATPLSAPWVGWSAPAGSAGVAVTGGGTGLRVDYRLAEGQLALVPPAAPGAVPVLTDPATAAAAAGGTATLLIDGLPFDARPVAATGSFPTVEGRFAVLDAHRLADLIDRTEPGTASPAEVWVSAAPGHPLAGRPLAGIDGVDVRVRSAQEEALRSDPVARSATALLVVGAGLGLAVALTAVVLLVVAERSDDAAVRYAWESDGVAPGTLRSALWWGAAATVLPAAVAGTAAGLALATAATRLVAVTATATTPVPPLRVELWDPAVLAATAGGVLVVLALAGLTAARSLREPLPVRHPGTAAG